MYSRFRSTPVFARRRPEPASPLRIMSGRLPVSRSMVSTVLRQTSKRTPCATRLSTRLRLAILRAQQVDPRTERHHLDRDLVGIVGLEQIVGDADHEALFLRIIVRKLQRDAVLGERLVRQRRRLGAGERGDCCRHQRRHRRAAEGANDRPSISRELPHPCPAIPGLSSTPLKVTPEPRWSGAFPEARCLARISHTGLPCCSLTEAHPATL